MGHDFPNMLGVSQQGIAKAFSKLVPDYMPMGETGMSEMSDMAEMMDMPLPENTLPMMMGKGRFGPIEMGGMFTTLKVRQHMAKNDYTDPGDYAFPEGSVAHVLDKSETLPEHASAPAKHEGKPMAEVTVRKPHKMPHDH